MWEALQDQRGRLLDSRDGQSFDSEDHLALAQAKGLMKGLEKALEILEDIAEGVRYGERPTGEVDKAGEAANGSAGEN